MNASRLWAYAPSWNDALGAQPDAELLARTPEAVRKAVSFGRPIYDGSA